MKFKQLIIGMVGVSLFSISLATQAEVLTANRPGAVTFSFMGGNYWFAPKRHINNTEVSTVDVAYNFDKHWAAEFGWTSLDTSQKGTDGQGVLGNLFTLDGIYRFQQHGRFQPYLLAGIGNLGLKTTRSNSTQQGNFNAGVGGQFFMANFVAFRGEVRDIYTTTQGINDWMASLGLSFLIG